MISHETIVSFLPKKKIKDRGQLSTMKKNKWNGLDTDKNIMLQGALFEERGVIYNCPCHMIQAAHYNKCACYCFRNSNLFC